MLFELSFNTELSFIATTDDPQFRWAIRTDTRNNSISLYPESPLGFSLQVFENKELIFETYKCGFDDFPGITV